MKGAVVTVSASLARQRAPGPGGCPVPRARPGLLGPRSYQEPFPWAAGHTLKNAQVAKLSAKALMNGSNYIQVAEPTAILIKSGPGKLFGRNTRESLMKMLPKH